MEDINDKTKEKLGNLPAVIDRLIGGTANPKTLYTRDNLVLLVKCWNDFCMWTLGTQYWHKEFPEWSFMISQFQVFVNQSVVNQMMTQGTADKIYNSQTINGILGEIAGVEKKMKGMEANITTTTSSIQDLQGRVKELERPWYSRSGKNKARSGSGERMVDLLEDLEKLSCSEKREED
jgi:hypothetical protein